MVTCTITPCRAAVRLNSGVRPQMADQEKAGKPADVFARLICLGVFLIMAACTYLSYATWGLDFRTYGFGLLAIAMLFIGTVAPASTRAGVVAFFPWF